jgi:hypothetical protein
MITKYNLLKDLQKDSSGSITGKSFVNFNVIKTNLKEEINL